MSTARSGASLPYSDPRHQSAEQFLVEEAHLLDTSDFEAWLGLMHPQIRYRMPVRVTAVKATLRRLRDGPAMSRLAGNRALIVGAGSGIGRGVHDAFLAEGASVGSLEIDPHKWQALAEASAGPVICGDATSADDNDAAVAAMLDAFDGIDTLVSCVGLFDFYLGLGELARETLDDAFAEIMNVNVRSMLLSVRAAIEPLRESQGTVILTGSTSSFMPGRGGILYVASKFAVRGCVVSLAHELAPEIRVNGVAPGGTHSTDLRGLLSLGLHERSLGQEPDRAESIRQRSRLGVALGPADHAESYVFLASEASRGMTGRFIHSDGGANIG